MKENALSDEDKSFIDIPTFSAYSGKKRKRVKFKINKKSVKNDYEEAETFNNNFGNITETQEQYLGPDIDSIRNMIFDKNVIDEVKKDEEKKNEEINNEVEGVEEKQFGRKKKDSKRTGKHNKYSGDNLFRKCKGIILNSLFKLINNIIIEQYGNEECEKHNLKLLKINQSQIINSEVDFNKGFMHKKLKDIFSEDITQRFKRYNIDHNKNLIKYLLNESNEDKRKLFNKIFNLTFLDCLNHFRGTKIIKELDNLTKYEDVCKEFEEDEDYLCSFKYYIENYEKIMDIKKPRKKKKEKEKQKQKQKENNK